jgi:hypothetical protein
MSIVFTRGPININELQENLDKLFNDIVNKYKNKLKTITDINSYLSELKEHLINLINANEILEKQLNNTTKILHQTYYREICYDSNLIKKHIANTKGEIAHYESIIIMRYKESLFDSVLRVSIKYTNVKTITEINSNLSELKEHLSNFINANEILEHQLNSINNNKNDQVSDNWREDMLNEHKNKLIKEQQLQKIRDKINLIKKKITETNKCIANYEKDIITRNRKESDRIKQQKEHDELYPIISMFNSQIVKHSKKVQINFQTAKIIKNIAIDQILFDYNSLKKYLSENFNPSLVEPICNHFASKYSIKNLIPTEFNCLVKIFLDLIIFIRPDIESKV